MLFPTTLVGSYPQPEGLIDRAKLAGRFPPLDNPGTALDRSGHPNPVLVEAAEILRKEYGGGSGA